MDLLTREDLALEKKNTEDFETSLKWTAASMYAGMLISSAVLNMILAMATNQDKLKIAQAELNRVIGSRLPNIADRENLPYVDAIIRETFRWHPPLPMAIARASIYDDVYRGRVTIISVSLIVN
ncbi:hypothetical protein C0992_009240 [Termitomyces sp. T32_za158]|nr:hypothetical protein C0992_009240 [Termitomyces sp. T32_za158]